MVINENNISNAILQIKLLKIKSKMPAYLPDF
jgi:hypothetical protein